jgi:hypothetical protein
MVVPLARLAELLPALDAAEPEELLAACAPEAPAWAEVLLLAEPPACPTGWAPEPEPD